MTHRHAAGVALLIAPFVLQACATRGFVRKEIAVSRAATDSVVLAEQNARIAADEALSARITGLRSDFDSLRTQFGAKIAMLEDGLRFAMPITFAYDDASVRSDARPMLERFVRVVQKYYPGSTITVEGFADPAGTQSYNMALSSRRAANVRDALAHLGLGGNPLRTMAFGESRLVHPDAARDEPGAEANRRVVFVIENAGADAAIALGPSGPSGSSR